MNIIFLAKYENVELPGYEQPAVYKEDLIVNIFFIFDFRF